MPLFVVHALDRKGGLADRRKFYDEHRAYVGSAASKRICMIMSGPILAEDGDTSAGSFYLMEAPDRATVVNFNKEDPFTKNGIWEKVEINAFLRRAP
jgi:uncharacterized protein YciI